MALPAESLEQGQQALGAGQMAFFDDDFPTARSQLESAFKHFRDAGDLRSAARVAADIAGGPWRPVGQQVRRPGDGSRRGMRLVEQIGPGVEAGYLELAMIACEIPDVVALEAQC